MAYHEIDSRGSLYFLINAFIGAYNRRTDAVTAAYERRTNVMEASTDLSIQRKIDALTSRVDPLAKTLDTAVDKHEGDDNGS